MLIKSPEARRETGVNLNLAEPLVQVSLLGEAIDNGPILVLVADDDMNYVAVNRYAADVLGYTREELLSLKVTDVAPGPDTYGIFADFMEQRHQDGVVDIARKDGTRLKVQYSAHETTIAGMGLYVLVGSIVDG
jgi:PAS domain S-box-containing protein